MELFNCVFSAVPLKATTASAISILFIVKVCAANVVAVTAIVILMFRNNLEVLKSLFGVTTKEHSALEIDNNNIIIMPINVMQYIHAFLITIE